jgi:hypothetical protein
MKDAKRSKLEVIDRFDLQSMFCVSSRGRNEVLPVELKSQHPYLSGNLRQENKISKSMEIAAFKVKSRNLPMLTFVHSDLNI